MAVLSWHRAVLESTPRRWLDLAATLPRELLARRPAAGEWSALECLGHLLDADRDIMVPRVHAILAGRPMPAYDPDTQRTMPPPDEDPVRLAETFARGRLEGLAALDGLVDGDLARSAPHEELGTVTLGELLHEWSGHDLMHTVQAEQALMQPFIAGCGPWRPYFAAHEA